MEPGVFGEVGSDDQEARQCCRVREVVTVKIEMQLVRAACHELRPVLEIERDERRVGLERLKQQHANTFPYHPAQPQPHDYYTVTTTLCSAPVYSRIQLLREQRFSSDYAVKAGQTSHRHASAQPTLIYETRHIHALPGPLLIPHAFYAALTTYDLCTCP